MRTMIEIAEDRINKIEELEHHLKLEGDVYALGLLRDIGLLNLEMSQSYSEQLYETAKGLDEIKVMVNARLG